MANKLYPPILEASIPAFCGNVVSIPFIPNSLVPNIEYQSFSLQVKKINSELIGIFTSYNFDTENNIIYFNLGNSLGEEPNWYKFQIAYNNDNVGYYSTVAVGRYLGQSSPTLQLSSGTAGIYKAVYNHPIDSTEKAYSFHFILQDGFGEVIEDLGEQIHDINKDESEDTSVEFFEFNYNLRATDRKYYLHCIVKTINGLVLSTQTQISDFILSGVPIDSFSNKVFTLEATLVRENGNVKLAIAPNNNAKDVSLIGKYVIRRTSSKDNHLRISTVARFALHTQPDLTTKDSNYKLAVLEDYTVEAGYYYYYYIQQYNDNGYYSSALGLNDYPIYVSFDDCFLYDGERQLCIQYNPKISSFKTNIQQQKIETIGNKYPYIVRNGNINYKEFPISGLVSFNMDENNLFMKEYDKERLGIILDNAMRGSYEEKTRQDGAIMQRRIAKNLQRGTVQNLVDINISAEKEFKLEVLDFLNSSKPKLFKSATEGNYCVYTMNSTLSPNDALGRMLHTFNCTAYEIMNVEDFYKSLIVENKDIYDSDGVLISIDGIEETIKYNKTITLTNLEDKVGKNILQYNEFVRYLAIRDANPLSQYRLSFVDLANPTEKIADQIITIGSTGSYNYFSTPDSIYIKGIYILPFERQPHNSDYVAFILKRYITIDYSDFNYLTDYDNTNSIGNQILPINQDSEGYVSYIVPSIIKEDGTIEQNSIGLLKLFRVENRNEEHAEYAKYCINNNYYLNKELQDLLETSDDILEVYISKELSEILDSYYPQKMSVEERAAYLNNHAGEEGYNVVYKLEKQSEESWEDILQSAIDSLEIRWSTILVPPSTTINLIVNMENVPNIVVNYSEDNQDLYYEVSANLSVAKYNYGG